MKKTIRGSILFLVLGLFSSHPAVAALRIIEPPPGAAYYQQESVPLRAEWTGQSASGLRFVWSARQKGDLAQGLNATVRDLSYRVHSLRVRAMAGDSVVAEAETGVTILSRPDQFTLSERTDWEGEVSPRGSMVAFSSWRSGDPEIWTANVANRGVSRITFQGGWAPSWSSDGRYLVFWSERAGTRDLWLLELGKDQLTADRLTPGRGYNWMPVCSPVDSRVAYCAKSGAQRSLKILDYTTFDQQEPREVVGPEEFPMFPRWFPGGEELLFTSYRNALPVVCRVSLTDGEIRPVSEPGAEDADISPDGKLVVLVRDGNLWLLRLADGLERRLTREGAGALSPRFFPDGSKILFASSVSGNYDLWVLDLPGMD